MGHVEEVATFTSPFDGDLSEKYIGGGIGTYERTGGSGTTEDPYVWTKQN